MRKKIAGNCKYRSRFLFCKYTDEARRAKRLYQTARHVRKFVGDLFAIQVYIYIQLLQKTLSEEKQKVQDKTER